jgi:hypothetical protein
MYFFKKNWFIVSIAFLITLFMLVGITYSLVCKGIASQESAGWMQALGSFFAIIAAIWIANSENRRRQKEQETNTKNAAISIRWKLNIMHHSLKGVCEHLVKLPEQKNDDFKHFNSLAKLLDEHPILQLSDTTIKDLNFLPNNAGNKLVSALDSIQSNIYMMKSSRRNRSKDENQIFASSTRDRLLKPMNQLQEILDELKQYSPEN